MTLSRRTCAKDSACLGEIREGCTVGAREGRGGFYIALFTCVDSDSLTEGGSKKRRNGCPTSDAVLPGDGGWRVV